jgi:hypothetical protein
MASKCLKVASDVEPEKLYYYLNFIGRHLQVHPLSIHLVGLMINRGRRGYPLLSTPS